MAKIVTASEVDIRVTGQESLSQLSNSVKEAAENAEKVRNEFGENSEEFKKADAQAKSLAEGIENLSKEAKELNDKGLKKVKKSSEEMKEGFDDAAKSSDKLGSATDGAKGKFSAFGLALKGLGIGLIVKAVQWFSEVLGKNQRVADAVSTTFNFLSLVFNDFINLVLDNIPPIVKGFKAIFDDPLGSLKSFGESVERYLIESFTSLIEMTGHLGKALRLLFEGDFKGAWESTKEALKEGVDVLTGVDDSVNKVSEGFKNATSSLADYASKSWKAAESITALENASGIAAAQQQRLVEIYDRQAEKLRQVRDNDLQSISDRITANEELEKVLNKQETAMVAAANAQIAAASAQVQLNDSNENRIALIEAQANKEAVLAQIEGFRSEQMANSIALQKEQMDLDQRQVQAKEELTLKEKEFNASQIEDEQQRLEAEREILEQEKLIEQQRLEVKVNSYKEGTSLRLEAEIELKERLQEINQQISENQKAQDAKEIQAAKDKAAAKAAIEQSAYNTAAAFSNLIGELGNENIKVQKAQALIQIGIDTASAISSLVKMSQANPANAATSGIAGALQFATGLLQIGTNMAKAASILGSSANVPNVPEAPQVNAAGANLEPQQQQDTRVYITETDIANSTSRRIDLTKVGIVE